MMDSAFLRAEAAWLTEPEYRPGPDEIAASITRICTHADRAILSFTQSSSGPAEESGDLIDTIKGAKNLIIQLDTLSQELLEYESMGCGPDEDAEYDAQREDR